MHRGSDIKRQPFKRVERRLAGRLHLATDASTSARMARVRREGTAPELLMRRALTALGLRYTINNRDLAGSPDLANRSRRWAAFVHGCYWHRHMGCRFATTPKRNSAFWLAKFARNIQRDHAAVEQLRRAGYRVTVVWQCELELPANLWKAATRIASDSMGD